jgi:hypothetical protein
MDQDTYLSFDSNSEWVRTKQALNDFNQAHGTPGVMPTSTELRRVGCRDLDQTIRKLGGYAVVATQFGFTMGIRVSQEITGMIFPVSKLRSRSS